ncbi:hypothetical protein ACVPOS_09795 [Staphylococcus aureus]
MPTTFGGEPKLAEKHHF